MSARWASIPTRRRRGFHGHWVLGAYSRVFRNKFHRPRYLPGSRSAAASTALEQWDCHSASPGWIIYQIGSGSYSIRTYAVGGLNVISSDERSEKSLIRCLASSLFRDFSSQAPRPRKERPAVGAAGQAWSKQ